METYMSLLGHSGGNPLKNQVVASPRKSDEE
jgi:hypothetical protein